MWRAHVHLLGFLIHALGSALFSRGQLSWMWMVHHVRKWVSRHPHQTEAGATAAAQALDSLHSQLLLPRRSLVVRLTPTRQPDSKCLRVVTFHWKLFGNASVCLAQGSQVLACYIIQSKVLQTTQQDKLGCGFPQRPVLDTAAMVYFCPWKKAVVTSKSWLFGWGLISMMCFQNILWYQSIPPIIRF